VAPAVIATPRRSVDDLEVASVNGRPVWASCVTAQASGAAAPIAGPPRAEGVRRSAALDQCIAFELLAQAAEAHGLSVAPEVSRAARSAAVNRLIETDFEQRYRTPDDLKPAVDALVKRNEWRMHVPELRSSTYARFVVPKDTPPALDQTAPPFGAAAARGQAPVVDQSAPPFGAAAARGQAPVVEAQARALAERVAAQLAGETGLYGVHLADAAHHVAVAAGSTLELEISDVQPSDRSRLVEAYATALYEIPEVGRISPAVRTQWGWDVVLWTGGIAARERTRAEVVAEAFPELQRHQFQLWAGQLGKQLGVHIEVDQAGVAALDTGAPP
jgi:hypothetical protein